MDSESINGMAVQELLAKPHQDVLDFLSSLDTGRWEEYKGFNFWLVAERASLNVGCVASVEERIGWLFIGIEVYSFLMKCSSSEQEKESYEQSMMNCILRGIRIFGSLPDTCVQPQYVIDWFQLRVDSSYTVVALTDRAVYWKEHWNDQNNSIEELRMLRRVRNFIRILGQLEEMKVAAIPERYLLWLPLIDILP